MPLLLLTPPLPAAPWSISPFIAALLFGLAQRNHPVTLLADSIEDPDQFSPFTSTLHTFREFSQTATDFPRGLRSWAAHHRRALPHARSLSFSRHLAADLLLPLDPSPLTWLLTHTRTRSPFSLAVHLAKHRNIAFALPRPALAAHSALLTYGPIAHLHAAHALHLHPDDHRLLNLPRFSLHVPASPAERTRTAAHLRRDLNIPPRRPLLLLSAPESLNPRALAPLVAALRALAHPDPDSAPILLALVRDTFSLHRALGPTLTPHARILTPTHDIRPALLAADYTLAPYPPTSRNHSAAAALARLITDSLWLGTPVLALHSTPGADLITPTATRTPAPGLIVPRHTAEAWLATLNAALHPAALPAARAATDKAALAFSLSSAIDLIVEALSASPRTAQTA